MYMLLISIQVMGRGKDWLSSYISKGWMIEGAYEYGGVLTIDRHSADT